MEQNFYITARAHKAMELYLEHPEARGRILRLHVNGKNCDGFTYGISFSEWEIGDEVIEVSPAIDLLVDAQTWAILREVQIDWDTEEGVAAGGFVISNSNEADGKFKGKFWKKPDYIADNLAPKP